MMFYKKLIKGKKSTKKDVNFDSFSIFPSSDKGESLQTVKYGEVVYNFDISNGELRTGYGFKKLQMPCDTESLQDEEEIALDGSEVFSLWSFQWYDTSAKYFKYYLVYYNDLNHLGFVNLFNKRMFPLYLTTDFTQTPTGSKTRLKQDDALVFSSPTTKGFHLMTGNISQVYPDAPRVLDICSSYENFYAIVGENRPKLVYTQNAEVTEWVESQMSEISFHDDKGTLNKLLTFNDYVYVFRDFGINKISFYSTRDMFDTSLIYQSDSYIYPKTIASSGDKIYFMEKTGLFEFNGSTAKKLDFGSDEILSKLDLKNASSVCFEGKYYLACRYDFQDGQQIACESEEFINNVLFIFDIDSKQTNIIRGVDIRTLCAIINPYKSKVVACFNGESKGFIGELTHDGQIFGQSLPKVWTSVMSAQGNSSTLKCIKYLTIKCSSDCTVTLTSEQGSTTINVEASEKIQRLRTQLVGKEIKIIISADKDIKISNVKIGYNEI